LPTLFGFGRRSLKAQMKSADRAGVRYALILGDDEVAKDIVTVRDLRDSTQQTLPRARLITWAQETLAAEAEK